jgi:outer membrane protein
MRRYFLAASVAVFGFAAAPVVQAETLADALASAYKTSKVLDQNEALLRAADEDVAGAVAKLRPVVSFVAESQYASQAPGLLGSARDDGLTTTMSLVAQMTLLDFGRSRLGVEIAKESVLATREALRGLEQNVLLAAVDAYVNVRLKAEIVALRNSNVRLITQELRAAQDRFEVGEVTRTDVAIAEARLASARSGLAAAEGDSAVARERYRAVTGAYPGNLAGLPKLPATASSLDAARDIAIKTHPDIARTQRQVTVSELGVEAAKAGMRPKLTAQATVSLNPETSVDRESVGLSLNQTLYAGGALSSGYRQAVAQRDAQRAALAQTAINVAENVGNAWSGLQVADASIRAGALQVTAAQTAFDGVREEAKLGARTTLDVLNAEQELLDARATKLVAEAQRYVGVYQLLATMGLLTVEHLKLGVPTYDPAAYYNEVKSAPLTSPQGKKLDRILEKISK